MFLLFKKKLNGVLKMKFWAACRTGIYYHSGTGKREIYSILVSRKEKVKFFPCLKIFEQCEKGKI